MSVLAALDWQGVREHYDARRGVCRLLKSLDARGESRAYAELALGVSDPAGNYSAYDHGLGRKILGVNADAPGRVLKLAHRFVELTTSHHVPELVAEAGLKYLGISVGSELSCIVNPNICWVANTRTIWSHLVIKHADDLHRANEELALYRDNDVSSEMTYQIWSAIHGELGVSLRRMAEEGSRIAHEDGVSAGRLTFLWADAIANQLYMEHRE